MMETKSLYHGHRFPAVVISQAVLWYFRFNLSPSRTCCGGRAVGEHGAELDILLQKRRDKAAAKRFFKRVLRSSPAQRQIVTDQLRSYPAAKADIPELANVQHVFVKAAARVNNRAENSHQQTRERERRMRGRRALKRTQAFLSSFGPIRQHFALKRYLLRASLYRKQLAARFVAWRDSTEHVQNPLVPI
ncbi:DDE-type integrase/transposase/recombinase [Cupriavidus sp. PET2-C1]